MSKISFKMFRNIKFSFILFMGLLLVSPCFVSADTLNQESVFNINSYYDLRGRSETNVVLQKITNQLYFYFDKGWLQSLSYAEKNKLENSLYDLTLEFEKRIYPTLTKLFGSEVSAGINGDRRLTVLFHPMIGEIGGYTNSGDAYYKLQNPNSNERKIIYLNTDFVFDNNLKVFLAHEFTHLITLNQKNLLRGIVEDTWLNEARAEYSATLLGYDDIYKGSNLERRVSDFLKKPQVSLVEWLNQREDYGAVSLFTQYLTDHYGEKILADSLQSNRVGIESINYALSKNNYQKRFLDIFSDWLIALLVNDCSLGSKYCYLNNNLKDFRITPTIYYLPKSETIMSSYYNTAYWTTNWFRFIGGSNDLSLRFEGSELVNFKVPYLLCNLSNKCSVNFLSLDKNQKGEIVIKDFDTKYSSLTIMPFNFDEGIEPNSVGKKFSFSWRIATEKEESSDELINQLLNQIESLKRQILELQAQLGSVSNNVYCSFISSDLYLGVNNFTEVSCLQNFLKNQGIDIYPEGLVTGNFLSLTQKAVIRFQEKYKEEILVPFNLDQGTGFVGEKTRLKINQLIQ